MQYPVKYNRTQTGIIHILHVTLPRANTRFHRVWEAYSNTQLSKLLPLMILTLVFLTACQEGAAIPPSFCTAYNDSVYTLRLAGGAAMILSLILLGFKKQMSNIMPSQGAQTGAVVSGLATGVLLLALSTDLGGQILQTFGLPNLAAQC